MSQLRIRAAFLGGAPLTPAQWWYMEAGCAEPPPGAGPLSEAWPGFPDSVDTYGFQRGFGSDCSPVCSPRGLEMLLRREEERGGGTQVDNSVEPGGARGWASDRGWRGCLPSGEEARKKESRRGGPGGWGRRTPRRLCRQQPLLLWPPPRRCSLRAGPRAPWPCEFFLGRSERVLKPERASRRVRPRAAPVMEALCHSDVCNRSRWAG